MAVIETIYKAIDVVNDTQPADRQVEKSSAAALYGRQSNLDSLGLVTLIAELEGLILDEHGVQVTIADERAMSQKSSPFLTVSSLASYVETLIDEARAV